MGKFIAFLIAVIALAGAGYYFNDDVRQFVDARLSGGGEPVDPVDPIDPDRPEDPTETDVTNTVTQGSCRESARDVDEDGDGLLDASEAVYGTNVNVPDSDFDGYNDCAEVVDLNFVPEDDNFAFNPLIADIPSVNITVVSEPKIEIMWSESASSTVTVGTQTDTGTTSGNQSSNGGQNSTVSEHSHSAGVEITAGVSGWSFEGSVTGNYQYTDTTSNESSVTWDKSTSFERSENIAEINATETQLGKSADKATLRLMVDLVNTGDITVTLGNVALSAYRINAFTGEKVPVSNLQYEGDWGSPTLSPGEKMDAQVFWTDRISVATAKQIIAEPGGLIITAPTMDLLERDGAAFAHSMTQIGQRTARVIIDYGKGAPPEFRSNYEEYRVAVATGEAGGLLFSKIMRDILKIDYQTGTWDWSKTEAGTQEAVGPGLVGVRGVSADSAAAAYWIVTHKRTGARGSMDEVDVYNVFLNGPFDLDAISLRPGDVLSMVRVSDEDRDGLGERTEALYGSDPKLPDTDGDGLTDLQEVKGWMIKRNGRDIPVQSSPTSVDTDRDSYSDFEEYEMRDQGSHPGELNNLDPILTEVQVKLDGAIPTVRAKYGDGDPSRPDRIVKATATWSGLNKTTSADINKKSGRLSLTPPNGAFYNRLGRYSVEVEIEDVEGAKASKTVSFNIGIPSSKLVAHFPLDGVEISNRGDFSLVSRGRPKNDNVFSSDSVSGKSANLQSDGSERGIIIAPHIPFDATGKFTMTGWINMSSLQGNRLFGEDGGFGFSLVSNELYFGRADANSGDFGTMQSASSVKVPRPSDQDKRIIETARWYFIAGVADGRSLRLYVVDENDRTNFLHKKSRAGYRSAPDGENCKFVIGGRMNDDCDGYTYDDMGNQFYGKFDEIRLYNRDLSEGEIRALALEGN